MCSQLRDWNYSIVVRTSYIWIDEFVCLFFFILSKIYTCFVTLKRGPVRQTCSSRFLSPESMTRDDSTERTYYRWIIERLRLKPRRVVCTHLDVQLKWPRRNYRVEKSDSLLPTEANAEVSNHRRDWLASCTNARLTHTHTHRYTHTHIYIDIYRLAYCWAIIGQ